MNISLVLFAAEQKKITLGGKSGWNQVQKMENLTFAKGRFGYDSLELKRNSAQRNSETDLLLDFEDSQIQDSAHNYEIVSNSSIRKEYKFMGDYISIFQGKGGISLRGNQNAIFGKSGLTGSFLIEFWLNPSIVENGEILLSWRSSRTVANYPLYQMIRSSFQNNHLVWNFTNVFNGYTENGGEISLQSYRTIIPNKWAHHELRFNEETGFLEYRIDGRLEDLRYVTTNQKERGGSVYQMELGVVANLEICPLFNGFLDDFRIQKGTKSESAELLRYDLYKNQSGRFESEPILISQGASLNYIEAIVDEKPQTDIAFYVRSGDNFYNWTDDFPFWKKVNLNEQVQDVNGFYFQVAADFFPDGNGDESPSITEISLIYTEFEPPLPPYQVFASAGNGEVTLNWTYSVDSSAQGYLVFYGERPGEYLGQVAVQGSSPIDVGNKNSFTLTGLKNGKIYYFVIASYFEKNNKIVGDFSKEVYARPMRN